jgi:hypothetical protein
MVYGMLSIQILEDVQALTDSVARGHDNQNSQSLWIVLHGLCYSAEADIFLRREQRAVRAALMQI